MFTGEQLQAVIDALLTNRNQLTEQVVNQALRIAALEADLKKAQAPSQD